MEEAKLTSQVIIHFSEYNLWSANKVLSSVLTLKYFNTAYMVSGPPA